LLEVIGKFGSDPVALVAEQATATEYASLAPVALAYAEAGDPFAEEIVAEGARQADGLIRSLVEFGALPVSLLGALASRMVQWLAVAGPLLLARRKGSVPIASSGQRKGAQIC
jgi:glucosamine kinase